MPIKMKLFDPVIHCAIKLVQLSHKKLLVIFITINQQIICKPANSLPTTPPPQTPRTPSLSPLPDTSWIFQVKFNGRLCSNESIALCGSNDVLGNWSIEKCLLLTKTEKDSSLWAIEVTLPRTCNMRYRYLICATDAQGRHIMRFWEAHKAARLIRPSDEQDLETLSYDTFGMSKKAIKIERAWITEDVQVVQLKFYRAPFMLNELNLDAPLYIKVTAVKMEARGKCQKTAAGNKTVQKNIAFCEVASLDEKMLGFHYQSKYGTPCGPQNVLIFHLTVGDFENIAYLIDLYSYPAKAAADIPPYHVGYQYILPLQLKRSEGSLNMNIMCATKHRSIGTMTCSYLVVKSLHSHTFNLKDSCHPLTKKKQSEALDIGHRGCGSSYWFKGNILRENTLNSFNVAYEHGSEMVEFDVHLTQDKIPIIYHDFQLYVSRKTNLPKEEYDILRLPLDKKDINLLKPHGRVLKTDFISVPLNQFRADQLKHVKVYEIPESSSRSDPCQHENKSHLPFPTLEYAHKKLPLQLGFNIEIKWPQQLTTGRWEENFFNEIDKNEYVDIILDVVLKFASTRNVVFSSFDADICTMIRLKQPRYPVMFICHANDYQPKFLDPRGDSLLMSLYFASAIELCGVVGDSLDILQMSREIANFHERNLRLFAWGAETRCEKHRKALKASGVDGIIFDRINHIMQPEDLKQNVVLIELHEIPLLEEEMCNGEN